MTSTQITLLDTPSSPELARRLQQKCEALNSVNREVHYCRVKVAGPVAGEAHPEFSVTLRVFVPGALVAVEPVRDPDLRAAVNRAFAAAAERLAAIAGPPPRTAPAKLTQDRVPLYPRQSAGLRAR